MAHGGWARSLAEHAGGVKAGCEDAMIVGGVCDCGGRSDMLVVNVEAPGDAEVGR